MGTNSVKEDGTVQQVHLDVRSKRYQGIQLCFYLIFKTAFAKTHWLSHGLKVRLLSVIWGLLFLWYHKLSNIVALNDYSCAWSGQRVVWLEWYLVHVLELKMTACEVVEWSCQWQGLKLSGSCCAWIFSLSICVWQLLSSGCFLCLPFWVSQPQVTWTHVPCIWRKQQHSPLY